MATESDVTMATPNDEQDSTRCLPADKYQERFNFIQEDVNIRANLHNLPNIEASRPEVMAFIARLKQHPIGLISAFAKAKSLPICNYYCYEIAGPQNQYVCVMEYDNQQYYGCLRKSKKEAKASAALRLIHHLYDVEELFVLDKEEKKKQPKAGVEIEETREAYEEANVTPIVDCPAAFTTLRDEIWRRFEFEGLPDPVFCPDAEKLLSEANVKPPALVNQHLAVTKEAIPDIIIFTAPVERNSCKYIAGTNFEEKLIIGALGRSKQQAKQNCAAAIVDYLVRTNKFTVPRKLKRKIESAEFCQDSPSIKQGRQESSEIDLDGRTILILSCGKSPQSIVNEYCSKNRIRPATYEFYEQGCFFKAKCIVDGVEAVSTLPAASKQKAKDSAATRMLDLFVREGKFDKAPAASHHQAPDDFIIPHCSDLKEDAFSRNVGGDSIFEVTQNLVYNAVHEAIENIPEMSGSSVQFAGCVILDSDNDQASLISWATGNGYNSTPNHEGTVINDCYAEVLCRRGIVLFLLDEVHKHINSLHSIFMLGEGTLKLRGEYSFHLFLSHSPNGDAARAEPKPWKFDLVFPVADYPIPPGLGQLSLKDIGINALKPISPPLGMPAPMQCSMSSSDKMLKWNVCGIQGAMLAKFIEPVHFHSISIEKNYDSRHCSRALYSRAKLQGQLHYPFRVNKPILVSAIEKSLNFPESDQQLPQRILSMNWNSVDGNVEIINSMTGITFTNEPSRLCQLFIYNRFQQIMQTHYPQYASLPYSKLKMESHLYIQSSITLKRALQIENLGIWPVKGPSASMVGIRSRPLDFTSDEM